jgi:CRISPR-associated protein Csb2
LHDDRYHGMDEWPPSAARLFQALVAGAARGAQLDDDARTALEWLESRSPPVLAVPRSRAGQRITVFGPDNDLDGVGNDPARVGEIRSAKIIAPRIFDSIHPLVYAWELGQGEDDEEGAHAICRLANRLYQFGRGVDMAWARGEIMALAELDERLARHTGPVYRPALGASGRTLRCPQRGSLASLIFRHASGRNRFRDGGPNKQLFVQPPKPRFAQVPYESPPVRHAFALRPGVGDGFFAYPHARVTKLLEWLRDEAASRLRRALPERVVDIERVLIGRKPNGTEGGPASDRVRIIPLPSVGHEHVDRGIRRVLVEVPSGCALPPGDVAWAFSGIEHMNTTTGEIEIVVTRSEGDTMVPRYLETQRIWRSVTPAVLPEPAKRRRIDPIRRIVDAKGGEERLEEERRAAGAVVQALRHANVDTRAETIRVQREPFSARGERVEAFADDTRFSKHRLWHVEIKFERPVRGPLVIGDGRFLGLGVMAPVASHLGVHAFDIVSGLERDDAIEVTRAARRAIMARAQTILGSRQKLPTFFSGHGRDGAPARSERRSHIAFAFDPTRPRLLVLAPHIIERRHVRNDEKAYLATLDEVLADFSDLRAGAAGRLTLRAIPVDFETDPIFAPSLSWKNLTPYVVTRHAKGLGAAEALKADIAEECRRRSLPLPRVSPVRQHGVPGTGLVGDAELSFAVAVRGPIVLGRTRYLGGGLFVRAKG